MDRCGNTAKKHSLWRTVALMAPVTHVASGTSWLVTLAMAIAAVLIGRWAKWGTGWVLTVQKLWAAMIAGNVLRWSVYYWSDLPFCNLVPIVLLGLVLWTLAVPGKAERIVCVLMWPLALMLGAVLLSGVSNIKQEFMVPDWQGINWLLIIMLLVPSEKGNNPKQWVSLLALGVSVIASGVISPQVASESQSGILELSRSLSLLGITERFESLIAAFMTIGFYCAIAYLIEPAEQRGRQWLYGAIVLLSCVIRLDMNGAFYGFCSVMIWIILPRVTDGKNERKKEKGIDKTD